MADSNDKPIGILGVEMMFNQFIAKVFENHPDQIITDPGHLKPLKDSFAGGIACMLKQSRWLIENGCERGLMFAIWQAWEAEAEKIVYEDAT